MFSSRIRLYCYWSAFSAVTSINEIFFFIYIYINKIKSFAILSFHFAGAGGAAASVLPPAAELAVPGVKLFTWPSHSWASWLRRAMLNFEFSLYVSVTPTTAFWTPVVTVPSMGTGPVYLFTCLTPVANTLPAAAVVWLAPSNSFINRWAAATDKRPTTLSVSSVAVDTSDPMWDTSFMVLDTNDERPDDDCDWPSASAVAGAGSPSGAQRFPCQKQTANSKTENFTLIMVIYLSADERDSKGCSFFKLPSFAVQYICKDIAKDIFKLPVVDFKKLC